MNSIRSDNLFYALQRLFCDFSGVLRRVEDGYSIWEGRLNKLDRRGFEELGGRVVGQKRFMGFGRSEMYSHHSQSTFCLILHLLCNPKAEINTNKVSKPVGC